LLLMELGLFYSLPRRDGGLDLLLRAPRRAGAGRDVLLDDVIIQAFVVVALHAGALAPLFFALVLLRSFSHG